jgi:hypothetical protein
MNEFKKGYQPRDNFVRHENGYMLTDSHSISNRWKNYFCLLLNLYDVNDARQTEMHAYEPFVPGT